MVHREQPAAVELHTGVVPRFLASALSERDVWERARVVEHGAHAMRLPHPTDLAAISFLHAEFVDLGTALWLIPLRQYCDLAMLQTALGDRIDWTEIGERAGRVDGRTRLGRYAYTYEQLTGKTLLPDRKYSRLDALGYRMSLAAIKRPGLIRWPLRARRLSTIGIQRKYGAGSGGIALALARTREMAGMLKRAVLPDRE
jgi:hypothetical protein